ncbi:hypothetical protein ACQ3G6_15585 [Allorhizobium undicola]|uniref:hypothetical protein n=1 Tax=Allorhizobium undicola TaxID=78527 RepID=UPI000AA2C207|nr:hypothetical protein [Allorhizobium undicola]
MALLNALKARHRILCISMDEERRKPRPCGQRLIALRDIACGLRNQIAALERHERLKSAH